MGEYSKGKATRSVRLRYVNWHSKERQHQAGCPQREIACAGSLRDVLPVSVSLSLPEQRGGTGWESSYERAELERAQVPSSGERWRRRYLVTGRGERTEKGGSIRSGQGMRKARRAKLSIHVLRRGKRLKKIKETKKRVIIPYILKHFAAGVPLKRPLIREDLNVIQYQS